MFVISKISLFSEILWTLLILLLCYFIYFVTRSIQNRGLPPGPKPWPLIGNLLYFRGTKEHWSIEITKLKDKYGPVFTIWLGGRPFVFILDLDIGKETFTKSIFTGRPDDFFSELLNNGKHCDVALNDYGPQWEALRRVAHTVVINFAKTEKLVNIVNGIVDYKMETLFFNKGFDKPFDPSDYIWNTFFNIMAANIFGKRYEMEDPEYIGLKHIITEIFEDNTTLVMDFIPLLRKLNHKSINEIKNFFEEKFVLIKNKYLGHYKDHNESVTRDLCDGLITAKNEALRECKESAAYLTDDNISATIINLLFAGTDTSAKTFQWMLLFLTFYSDVQKKLRQEIETEIGSRLPTHSDRNRCHYVMAFISETLRFRNIFPNGVVHKAMANTKIMDYSIPEGTLIMVMQSHILMDDNYFPNPQLFQPERFLENGQPLSTRPKAYIPFGVGRRVCLGEKLAIADLFLVLVRFLQKTADYELILHTELDSPLQPDPDYFINSIPKVYKISFKQK